MRLTIRHVTSYSYAQPMRTLVQSMRLVPSRFDGQTATDWRITVEGFDAAGAALPRAEATIARAGAMQSQSPDQSQGQIQGAQGRAPAAGESGPVGAAFRDGAGDWTQTVSTRGPVSRLSIAVAGTVETSDLSGVLRGHRESVPPGVYLRSTRPIWPDVALADLARGVIAATEGASVLTRAHALSAAASDAIAYVPGQTVASTTAAEALAAGKGVCQDHAHALIALAHQARLPARYVVGYLFAEGEGSEMAEASHAWAEIWVDGLGWTGFDPANRCCPDDRYVRLCSGFDAQDAAPIRGIAFGADSEHLTVDVAVERQEQ
jgi:transglutaminase-like putative cysteine protease